MRRREEDLKPLRKRQDTGRLTDHAKGTQLCQEFLDHLKLVPVRAQERPLSGFLMGIGPDPERRDPPLFVAALRLREFLKV